MNLRARSNRSSAGVVRVIKEGIPAIELLAVAKPLAIDDELCFSFSFVSGFSFSFVSGFSFSFASGFGFSFAFGFGFSFAFGFGFSFAFGFGLSKRNLNDVAVVLTLFKFHLAAPEK